MVKELEKYAFEFEQLHGQEIYLEVERSKGCKHLCIESFKAGANYANSVNPSFVSNGLDCKTIAIDEEVGDELTSDIDWENRRYEIAKAAITGLCANLELGQHFCIDVADLSVDVADELIKKLKQSNEAK